MRPSLPVRLSVLPCAALLVLPALADAALPLAFQGQLVTAADGAPVDDELAMGFRVYDGEAAGASVIWEAADLPVEVAGGLFVAYLDVDADLELQAALVTGTSLWLGVTIGQGPELAGRIPLAGSLGTVLAQQSQSLVGCGPNQDGVLMGGECLQLVTEAALTAALAAHADDPAAHHARFTAPEAVAAVNAAADHWTAAHHVALATIATSGLATDLVGELADGTLPEDVVRSGDLAPVATSGQLADLEGTADALARVAALEQELAAVRAALTQQAVASPLAFPPDGSKLHLYVATSGDDGDDGLTPQTPRRTLQAAWRLLPRWVPASGVVIHIKKGQYRGGVLLADRSVDEGSFIEVVGSDDAWAPASRDQVEILCDLTEPKSDYGIRVENASKVSLAHISISGGCTNGLLVTRNSWVDLLDVRSHHNDTGASVNMYSNLIMESCQIDHNTILGLFGNVHSMIKISFVTLDAQVTGIRMERNSFLECNRNSKSIVSNNTAVGVDLVFGSNDYYCGPSDNAITFTNNLTNYFRWY